MDVATFVHAPHIPFTFMPSLCVFIVVFVLLFYMVFYDQDQASPVVFERYVFPAGSRCPIAVISNSVSILLFSLGKINWGGFPQWKKCEVMVWLINDKFVKRCCHQNKTSRKEEKVAAWVQNYMLISKFNNISTHLVLNVNPILVAWPVGTALYSYSFSSL